MTPTKRIPLPGAICSVIVWVILVAAIAFVVWAI